MKKNDLLKIAGHSFTSRLIIGTGKFPSHKIMAESLQSSGTEMVTVALRRVNLDRIEDDIASYIDRKKYKLLPNTSGARTAKEAIRVAELGQKIGLGNWVKLEVTPEPRYLIPDGEETLKAATYLVKHGFVVLPYINADPILAKKLEDAGCATVMPLAAPIGTNKGLKTKTLIEIIIEQAKVPVVIDAGLGSPKDAAESMELGADAVLVNTSIAVANNPVKMAEAYKLAVKSGRMAYLAGIPSEKNVAIASSPISDFINRI